MPAKRCKHCGKDTTGLSKVRRGLCGVCYEKSWVRNYYPSGRTHVQYGQENDETMEEIEATIAEQMKCLPKWWHKEAANAQVDIGRYGKTGSRVQRRF